MDSPWVRRVMRAVENLLGACTRRTIWRNAGCDVSVRDHWIAKASEDEDRARRKLRALLREKEETQ